MHYSPASLLRGLGVCALLAAAACADAPTMVEPPPMDAARQTSASAGGGGSLVEVICLTSHATPGGPHAYRYGWVRLTLPAAARAKDGSTRPYRFRSYVGQTVVQAANCVVPNTELARARVDGLFGVRSKPKPQRPREGVATLFGDVVGLDPLEVNACQNGNEWPDCEDNPLDTDPGAYELKPCYDSADCHSGSSGGGTSSDPFPDPDEEGPEPCDTSDPVINHDAVEAGFDRIWRASNPDAPDQFQRREKGGFIIDTPNGRIVQDFPAEWTSGPCEITIPPNATAPPGTIGVIHTHPWEVGEQQISCGPVVEGTQLYQNYPGTFTADDQQNLATWGAQLGRTLTGYILDKDGIRRFTATSASPDSFGRCAF